MVLVEGLLVLMGPTTTVVENSSGTILWLVQLVGCIGGDFNVTRFPSERSGDSSSGSAMSDFSALLFELDLVDLPLAWGDFTWSNGRAWSRLDRFIVSLS